MPLLKMAFISRVLALAEPVPLTVAILIAKSLIRCLTVVGLMRFSVPWPTERGLHPPRAASARRISAYPTRRWGSAPRTAHSEHTGLHPSPSPVRSAAALRKPATVGPGSSRAPSVACADQP